MYPTILKQASSDLVSLNPGKHFQQRGDIFTGVIVTWNDLLKSQGVPSLTGLKLVAYGSRLTWPVN
eukprot:scaffold67958_cov58-Cyclotella_meneghiniana.AAC.2